ncbi:hypothetical protein B0H12DRAFT_1146810 [Mycena haematopus]|nr:hypothetical protein B0H12DRAFT_1163942 [Mycena haematopus]KAJ7231298.1 hypothetical protein B0H12DRAFT_1146810 [Mycena haematopus]
MRAISMRVREKSCLVVLCGRSHAFGVYWRPNLDALARCAQLPPATRMIARGGVSVASKEHGLTRDPRPTPNPLVSSKHLRFRQSPAT